MICIFPKEALKCRAIYLHPKGGVFSEPMYISALAMLAAAVPEQSL